MGDPYFYTPRQLAEHLLLTYPPEYKVSPTRLKNSIILGNDVSGKVFLCAISGPNDLDTMLGVETLGARMWLWDEIQGMRETSTGYCNWSRSAVNTGKRKQSRSEEVEDSEETRRPGARLSTGKQKRKRNHSEEKEEEEEGEEEEETSTTGTSTDMASEDGSFAPSSWCVTNAGTRAPTVASDQSARSPPAKSQSSRTSGGPYHPEASHSSFSSFWSEPRPPPPPPRPKPGAPRRPEPQSRHLRPRSSPLKKLTKSELSSIIDPSSLNHTEITTILRALREIPDRDIYTGVIRAAMVTARDGQQRQQQQQQPPPLSPASPAPEDSPFSPVPEIAMLYASWILSRSYPVESLAPGDVDRMRDFDSFRLFKVQFLNLLIPHERRRGRRMGSTSSTSCQTPTPTAMSTPTVAPTTGTFSTPGTSPYQCQGQGQWTASTLSQTVAFARQAGKSREGLFPRGRRRSTIPQSLAASDLPSPPGGQGCPTGTRETEWSGVSRLGGCQAPGLFTWQGESKIPQSLATSDLPSPPGGQGCPTGTRETEWSEASRLGRKIPQSLATSDLPSQPGGQGCPVGTRETAAGGCSGISGFGKIPQSLVTSDLLSSSEGCPTTAAAAVAAAASGTWETEWSEKQKRWGRMIVEKSHASSRLRLRPSGRPVVGLNSNSNSNSSSSNSGSSDSSSRPSERVRGGVPWGVDYDIQGNLTPDGLRGFVNWANRIKVLRWKYQDSKAYAEFVRRLMEMETQLAVGVLKTEMLHDRLAKT